MTDIVPRASGVAKREARGLNRDLSRLDAYGRYEIARIAQEADIQAERLAAIGYVGKRSLHEVALLSQLEQQLSALVPMAIPRLQGLSDIAALAMADVVSETVRRVKR